MRKLKPQPKERIKVEIPEDLRESLHGVFELIQQTKHDRDRSLYYDDALQFGAVCGGKCGTKLRPYVFTYYPGGDRKKGRWELTLHLTEVEDIGDGIMTAITLYCCTSPDCGCKFREEDAHCSKCDYVDE